MFSSCAPPAEKKPAEQKAVKQPRPDDFDDFWYQDDDGAWKNEYTDMGYEFAEDDDFYTEEELKKEEEKLFKKPEILPAAEPVVEPSIKPTEAVVIAEKIIPKPQESTVLQPEPVNDLVASTIEERKVSETTPKASRKERKKPADYEDMWYQDYDGNWYNEYDEMEDDEDPAPETESAPEPASSVTDTPQSRRGKSVSFDKDDVVPMAMRERNYQNPRDRWQWAFTKILQVGTMYCLLFIPICSS